MSEYQDDVPDDAKKFKAPDTSTNKKETKEPWSKETAREKAETRMEELVGQIRAEAEGLGLGGVEDRGSETKAFQDPAEEARREGVSFSHSFKFSDVPGVERKGLPTVGCHISVSDSPEFGYKESVEYGLVPNMDNKESLKADSLESAIDLYKEKYG